MSKENLPLDKNSLLQELFKLSNELFNLRFALASQQETNTAKLRLIRRKVARVKTALSAI